MNAATAMALLPDVKNYLHITWDDPDTDARMVSIIQSCAAYLDYRLGGPGDYMSPGLQRELLLERCRYMRDGALDVFETNYRSLLLAAVHERMMQNARETIQAE